MIQNHRLYLEYGDGLDSTPTAVHEATQFLLLPPLSLYPGLAQMRHSHHQMRGSDDAEVGYGAYRHAI